MKGSGEKGKNTILVADDDTVFRDFIKNRLERSGYNVIEAVDGIDAIRKFVDNRDRIQLLIIDIIMPKMHGKEVYETIKKMMPDVKAIFITGYDSDFIQKKIVLEEGMDLILKPDIPKILLVKVREALKH